MEDLTLESFDDNQRAFIDKYVSDKVSEIKPEELNYATASDFLRKEHGAVIFPKEDDYKAQKIKAAKDIADNWDTETRKALKAKTGINWDKKELLPEYIDRVFNEWKPNGESFNAELESIKTEKQQLAQKLQEYQEQVEGMEKANWENKVNGWISSPLQGRSFDIPKGLSEDEAKDFVEFQKQKYINSVKNNFEFSKDDLGNPFVKDKEGKVYTNISEAIGKHIANSGFRFSENNNKKGGTQLPSGGQLSDEAKKIAIDRLESELFEKGLYPNSEKYQAAMVSHGFKNIDDFAEGAFKEAIKKAM